MLVQIINVENDINIYCLPALKDNYIFILHFLNEDRVIAVDPSEPESVEKFLKSKNLSLSEIWITHHHSDHIGGVNLLQAEYQCLVRGSGQRQGLIPKLSHPVEDQIVWNWGNSTISILFLPGHTLDHVGYWVQTSTTSLLFSGDVLFGLGCGRVFEGTYEMMLQSLHTIFLLPEKTLVFCSHEYTLNNIEFAQNVLGDFETLRERIAKVRKQRAQGLATVPLVLEEELKTNPFLLSLQSDQPLLVFTRYRDLRNNF